MNKSIADEEHSESLAAKRAELDLDLALMRKHGVSMFKTSDGQEIHLHPGGWQEIQPVSPSFPFFGDARIAANVILGSLKERERAASKGVSNHDCLPGLREAIVIVEGLIKKWSGAALA